MISHTAAGIFDIENPALWSNRNEFSIFMDTFEMGRKGVNVFINLAPIQFGPTLDIFSVGIVATV